MEFIKSGRRFSKDIDLVRTISEKIEKRISQSDRSLETKINNLSIEELQDLRKIVNIAEFILLKYEDKKETRSILEEFVTIIKGSAESVEEIDDEVSELIISAEDSINKVKAVHTNISEKYDFKKTENEEAESHKNSSNNLTKFPIEINSQGYQQNSKEKDAQVI